MSQKRIAIIGSTGSIGTQALDVVRQHRDLFSPVLLTAHNNVSLLAAQAAEFGAETAVICNPSKADELKCALSNTKTRTYSSMDTICSLIGSEDIDIVLVSTVGFSGLKPTAAALTAGVTVALANKETLVAGGASIMELSRKHSAPILPVDSEHSAIFQCLLGAQGNKLKRIHLTASGGPFLIWDKERIQKATREEALKHPRWNMGAKITIDSASMMNKGFEMIEARWLFDVMPQDINIVIHPQSIIHSMVEFEDGAVIAQLGHPDMREPIQFALSYPERLPLNNKKLDFSQLGGLTFGRPDTDKFPCLGLAFEAIRRGGSIPCVMNAANEAAVAAFLSNRIPFGAIPRIIEQSMGMCAFCAAPSLEDLSLIHEEALARANELIKKCVWQF